MRVGYVRVSSVELKQKADVEKFFVEKISSKSANRSKFDEMMNCLVLPALYRPAQYRRFLN